MKWSAKDGRYDQGETEKKLAERRKHQSGASLCRQFHSETDLASKDRCEACPNFGINSPISLGWPSPEEQVQAEDAKKKAALLVEALVAVEEMKAEIADQLDDEGEVTVKGDKSAHKDKEYQKHLVIYRHNDARAFEQLRIWLKDNGCRMSGLDAELDAVEETEFAWLTPERSKPIGDVDDSYDDGEDEINNDDGCDDEDIAESASPSLGGELGPSKGRFTMTHKGLYVQTDKGVKWVSIRFYILGLGRNPFGRDWGLFIRFQDRDRHWRTRYLPYTLVAGDSGALCASLLSDGMVIERIYFLHFASYLNRLQVKTRVTTVDRTGWHTIKGRWYFVLPEETIGPVDGERVILKEAGADYYEKKGTLADWQADTGVGGMAKGEGSLVLNISSALVASLARITGICERPQCCGRYLHGQEHGAECGRYPLGPGWQGWLRSAM